MQTEKRQLTQQNPDYIEIIQISDTHILSNRADMLYGVNTSDTLDRVMIAINTLESPDLILHTGDLVDIPDESAYENLLVQLSSLPYDIFCIPGNHDSPELVYELLNQNNLSTDKYLESEYWSVILLDTVVSGEQFGELPQEELNFLQTKLSESNNKHVLLAMHHHPVPMDSPWMDKMALENPHALFKIVRRYNNVKALIWGHIHNEYDAIQDGMQLMGVPSTCQQLKHETQTPEPEDKPLAYRKLTLFNNGTIASNLCWVE